MQTRKTRKWLILLGLLVLGAAGAFFAFQYLRPKQDVISTYETTQIKRGYVEQTIGATGNVHARQTVILPWETSGTVGKVLVNTGDLVKADQILASLEPESLPANVIQAQTDLVNAQDDLEKLNQSQIELAKAQVNVANAQKALNDTLVAQAHLTEQNASPTNIEVAQAAVDSANVQLNQAEQVYSLFEGRTEDDVQRLQAAAQVERAQKAKENAEINLQYAKSKPDPQTAARVNAAVEVAKATLQDATREVERLKNGPAAEDITTIQARIDAAKIVLSQADLIAPINGTVTELKSKPGDVVEAGTVAVRVEDMSEMHIKGQVPEVDISRVKQGQTTKITFDGIPKKEYLGHVTEIGQFGTEQQGNVTFSVEVRIENADQDIKPGMTGAMTIQIAQAENAVLIPNRAIRFRKGQPTVYVLQNGKLLETPVKLGITDETNSQLLSENLKQGDTIVVNPPEPTPGS